ncbi:hypothetical protein NBRC10512_006851 [Rhodotorula toruloides]|uniref:RHTO0S31e00452g1_1 n=2 Tax=Rhodotorula toruloides TaxID=5286 RepID=A0A061BIC4_RHOTO|nr:uncharacterized protein RHTO_01544 [Rhodotorula toruloides NP11]EMS21484.1 hypothetical protein RHTO_01544 [Rhodotorula toruloides NP11]CDR49736.1 RHTO0S31e00452g1_1 [Rhodotorula toruloides]
MRLTACLGTTKATRGQFSSLFPHHCAPASSSPHAADSMLPSSKDVHRDGMREPLCSTNLSHAMKDVTVSHHGDRPSKPQTDLPLSRDSTGGSLSTGERYEHAPSHPKPQPSASQPSLVDRVEGEAEELVGRWRHDAQLVEAGRTQRDYGREAIKQGMENGGGSVMR